MINKTRKNGPKFKKQYPKLCKKLSKNWYNKRKEFTINELKLKAPKVFNWLFKRCNNDCRKITKEILYALIFYDKPYTCKICGIPTEWAPENSKPRIYCSKECMNSDADVVAKREQTTYKKYGSKNIFSSEIFKDDMKKHWNSKGVTNPSQLKEVKEKKTKTCLKHYGTTHHMKNEKFKKQYIKNIINKYGVENVMQNPKIVKKFQKVFFEKYGVYNPMHVPEFVEQIKVSMMKKYGVDNIMYLPEVYEKWVKSAWGTKKVIVKGKVLKVQGYEPQVIAYLDLIGIIDKITCKRSNMPIIKYTYKNKEHRYFPDIFIKTSRRNKILIEVKSSFTLTKDYPILKKKFKAAQKVCKSKNITFWLAVVKKNKVNSTIMLIKNPNRDLKSICKTSMLIESSNIHSCN